jgi:hypothetical protein
MKQKYLYIKNVSFPDQQEIIANENALFLSHGW